MTEPERRPLTEAPKPKEVKKIPMPSLENEFFQMIAEHERYKEEREANAN